MGGGLRTPQTRARAGRVAMLSRDRPPAQVRFSATVSDGPQMGAVYATASALFVVAAKDAPPQPPAAAVAA